MDAIYLLGIYSIVPISFWYAGLTLWMWFFIALGLILGAFEAIAYFTTGKTLSQQFWALTNKTKKIIAAVCLSAFFAFLVYHLISG